MAKKKVTPKHEDTIMEKIGEQASHLKDEIVAGKDHLVEMAGTAITAVKEKIQEITHKEKKPAKKRTKKVVMQAKKTVSKKAIKKVAKKIMKKK